MEPRGGACRDVRRVRDSRVVVHEFRPRLGDALVAERDNHCRRTRRVRDDAGAETDPLLSPIPEGVQVVLEGTDAAARGDDDELDLGVEVVIEYLFDAAHERVACLPVELADKEDDRVTVSMDV